MSHEKIVFDAENHRYYVNGEEKPGVTSILKSAGLSPDFSLVNPEILAWKATLGKEVHKVIELILKDDLGDYDPVLEPYIQGAKLFIRSMNIRPIESELAVYSKSMDCCGTLDLVARYNGNEEGLFDFKTSSSLDLAYVGPQTAGYDLLYREWSGNNKKIPYNRFVVHLLPNGQFRLKQCKDNNDLNVFIFAVLARRNDQDSEFYQEQIQMWKERFRNVS